MHGGLGPGVTRIKKTGMLVILLRGVNCRVWSHSWCLGREVTIIAHSHRLGLCIKKLTKNVVKLII